uniref:non-specific serine/threonine protein kinase n=1 Tax=Brugia malayi TaxID=6279 RepID=A0A0J9XZ06_BRUMA|nr:Bm10455 [Brugia malayi]
MDESEISMEEEFSGGESSQIRRQNVEDEDSPWPVTRQQYRLEEIIGNGSTSIVYRGICTERNEICAIKRVDLENYSLSQLGREIRGLKECRHSNIVRYYTSFYVGQNLWIVMQLLDRGSLRQIMDRLIMSLGGRFALNRGLLTQPVIATILKEILAGLEYIHDSKLVHGDIKASNILISSEGNVQLADFGPSIWVENEERTRKNMPGTVCYLAPEIAVLESNDVKNDAYTLYVDIWSLGITTLEMAAGYPPYHNKVTSMKNAKQRWTAKKLITHPFITTTAQSSEYLTHTFLEGSQSLPTTSDDKQRAISRQLPPIVDNVENVPVDAGWDYDIEVEEEPRINRINKTPSHPPVRIPPSAELSMTVSIIRYEEKEDESERVIMATELLYTCRNSIEEQVFQLVKERKLEPKYLVLVAANLCKVTTAAQRQDLGGKHFAFVIEQNNQSVTVLEICITVWYYTTDHHHHHQHYHHYQQQRLRQRQRQWQEQQQQQQRQQRQQQQQQQLLLLQQEQQQQQQEQQQ